MGRLGAAHGRGLKVASCAEAPPLRGACSRELRACATSKPATPAACTGRLTRPDAQPRHCRRGAANATKHEAARTDADAIYAKMPAVREHGGRAVVCIAAKAFQGTVALKVVATWGPRATVAWTGWGGVSG